MNYIKNLAFDEKPDYQYLKSILGNIYENHNYSYDTIYDFTDYLTKKEKENKEKEKKSKINLSPSVGNDKEESSKKIEQNLGETNNIINQK